MTIHPMPRTTRSGDPGPLPLSAGKGPGSALARCPGNRVMGGSLAALAMLALAGCAGNAPALPSPVLVTPEPPTPRLASECYAPDPAEPVLNAGTEGATALDVVKHIEARKADRRTLVRLRAVCRASLVSHFPLAPGDSRSASRPPGAERRAKGGNS